MQRAEDGSSEWSPTRASFNQDLGFEKNGKQIPGVSVFKKTQEGKVIRVAKDVFGPGDDYCIT